MFDAKKPAVAPSTPTPKEIIWQYLYDRRRKIVPWIVSSVGFFTILTIIVLNQDDADISEEEWAEVMRHAAKLDEEHLALRKH